MNQHTLLQKWAIAIKIIPLVLIIGIIKFFAHTYNFEFLELNALFTSLVAGTVFLIGFLLTGVMADYKESEKIPSELAATLQSLFDDACIINKTKPSETSKQFIQFQKEYINAIHDWLYKKTDTNSILGKTSQMNEYFTNFDKEGIQAAYNIRMKNDQQSIRKLILRIDTIRETGFISSAYAIVETMGAAIAIGLIITKMDPFYASLFFTLMVTFLITYMFVLIKDLDDPFDYSSKGEFGTEIPLTPFHHVRKEITEYMSNS